MNHRRIIGLLAVVFAVACEPADLLDDAVPPPPPLPTADSSSLPPIVAPQESQPRALRLSDDERAVLDPRTRVPPRPVALLLAETAQLQTLMQSTGTSTSVKPQLLRRMAEDYVELAAGAEREVRAITSDGQTQQLREAMTNAQRAVASTARRGAIAYYSTLLLHPWNAPYTPLDEVRFYLALEYARVGDVANARQVANELLAQSPMSQWAAHAQFLLGLEADAQGDEPVARRAFMEAARSSAPDIARIARLRVGDARLDAPQAIARADARVQHDVVPTETKPPECKLDMECSGSRVCRNSVCIQP